MNDSGCGPAAGRFPVQSPHPILNERIQTMTDFDNTWRIGRCNNTAAHRTRTVYAWQASTGMRLDDVRCPRCGRALDRTSREARHIVRMTDDEIRAQRDAAITRYETLERESIETARAWAEQAEAGIDVERSEFHAEQYYAAAHEYVRMVERLRKAAARDYAGV